MNDLLSALGDPVIDYEEEAFLVFSQSIPSQSLGFVDSKASIIDLTVAGRDLSIHQSPTLLTSNRKEGTTGAVVWKVTPLFAEWISSANLLFQTGFLNSDSIVVELGTGISGIVALSLAPKVKRYIATDQEYVLKMLRENVTNNERGISGTAIGTKETKTGSKGRRSAVQKRLVNPSNIDLLALDWELDSVATLPQYLDSEGAVDIVIACDCIYNDALIAPFVNTCAQICRLRSTEIDGRPTLCIVAQQLRSPDVFESFMKSFTDQFQVWRVPDHVLNGGLKENSGFVTHIGILKDAKP